MSDPSIPALPDRYRILRELGHGGMATVHLAEDLKHHRQVAIKVLRPELSALLGAERFAREIELMAGLQHPHILPLFDSGEAGGLLYYVMPYVEDESLRDRLAREGRLPLAEAIAIAADVASALASAHQHGIVHRDIKPENILLSGGEALVSDFGIALAVRSSEEERLTATGMSLGTPAYMSPEQIAGSGPVDGRSDIYSLACVLHEMLTGEPPFSGGSAPSVLARAIAEPPPPVRSRRPEVPANVEAALLRALAKEPSQRFETATAFLEACALPVAAGADRRRVALIAVGAAVLATATIGALWRSRQAEAARASLPEVAELVRTNRFLEAYPLALAAAKRLPDDSVAQALLAQSEDLVTIGSIPAGAQVWLQRLPAVGEGPTDSVLLGRTPLRDVPVARAEYRASLHLEGHTPLERMVSSVVARRVVSETRARVVLDSLRLWRPSEIPPEMVHVPGGEYRLVSSDMPPDALTTLRPFLLDRFEVTNERYRAFLRSGRAPPGFTDRTGMPGPQEWTNQEPPAGRERHPVTGVSWVEASAFCAFEGKRLPTIYEWENAARDGREVGSGAVLPWGLMTAAVVAEARANFNSGRTVAVDALPFGVSWHGAHAMAGNAKEWVANRNGSGRAVLGGSHQDPPYLFNQVGELPESARTPAVGFRCARDLESGPGDQGAGPIPPPPVPPRYRSVDAATFQNLLAFYRYDRKAANRRGLSVTETEDWTRERYWIDGPGTDSVLVYLYLPKRASPPYQTLLFVPGIGAFYFGTLPSQVEANLSPEIRSGRALMTVVMDGMIERAPRALFRPPPPPSVEFRDMMVKHATEFRMAVDDLLTRPEIDGDRLAYYGISWGAGSRLAFAALERRTRAVILLGAGIDERVQPTLPEAANFNFAPYIGRPTLMVNGRLDEEHRWLTRAKPLWDLLRPPKELVLLEGAGHIPEMAQRVPPILAFLDRQLGPVRMSAGATR